MKTEIENLVRDVSSKYGPGELIKILKAKMLDSLPSETLTIICDDTLHQVPENLIIGERFIFSSGNFDTDGGAAIRSYLESRILALVDVLNSRSWASVRLIYSGHAVLASTVKFVVYRVAHIETVDILYFGGTGYVEVSLHLRDLLASKVSLSET